MSPKTRPHLLLLPRELRDEIYYHYLKEGDGYVHVPQSNRLRCSDGRLIDFSLMYTCKVIAAEMRGVPLKVNTITFKTYLAEEEEEEEEDDEWTSWSRAGRFDFLLNRLNIIREEVFAVAASMFGK